jgi:hypothetical protein
MVSSLHAHNLILLYEDLTDLADAIAAQADRRRGRRIPPSCIPPLALQYTTLAKYSEHVVRYQQAFGPDRVRCILFEELRSEPERVYAETLAFLGLEPAGSPEFRAYNPRLRWRNHRMAWALMAPYRYSLDPAFRLGCRLQTKLLRKSVFLALGVLFGLPAKAMVTPVSSPPLPPGLRSALRHEFREDVDRLANVLGRDLSAWLRPD